MGRQCLSGQQIEAACVSLSSLLKPHSMQTPSQQTAYLNEFVHVHQASNRDGCQLQICSLTLNIVLVFFLQMLNKQRSPTKTLPVLPLPLVDSNQVKTLVETKDPVASKSPSAIEASHVTFGDDEAHHSK